MIRAKRTVLKSMDLFRKISTTVNKMAGVSPTLAS